MSVVKKPAMAKSATSKSGKNALAAKPKASPSSKPAAVKTDAPKPGKSKKSTIAAEPAKATSKLNSSTPVSKTQPSAPAKPTRASKSRQTYSKQVERPAAQPYLVTKSMLDQRASLAQRNSAVEPVQTPSPFKRNPKLANNWKNKPVQELTDEEIMSMPETQYMGEVQTEFFRHRLQTLKHDLIVNAEETTETMRDDTILVPDPADRATIEEEHSLELRTRDRERKLLKKIDQALALLAAGEYGFCEETGEPIGLARLLARPTATLSLEAQQRRELRQKMFGE